MKDGFDPIARFALSYWKGEQPLWAAFWLWGIFAGTLFDIVFTPVIKSSLEFAFYAGGAPLDWMIFYRLLALFVFCVMYITWNAVSVWRCGNDEKPLWKWLSRGAYVLILLAGAGFSSYYGYVIFFSADV